MYPFFFYVHSFLDHINCPDYLPRNFQEEKQVNSGDAQFVVVVKMGHFTNITIR
jgi:hypothetical protein